MYKSAETFISQMADENIISAAEKTERLKTIQNEINETGTYTHTYKELEYGARCAWRNSNRCIGRLFWEKLHVIDNRHLESEEDLIESIHHHIAFATNDGKIRPTISIYPADDRFTIFNDQLIRYSNDPIVENTKNKIEALKSNSAYHYKIKSTFLPLLYQYNGQLKIHELPEDIVKEVSLIHPECEAFNVLHLKWYAVPIISGMELRIGGITYKCAPFNGWYMESEIASRNLLDSYRYDMIERIADSFGYDRSNTATYWRDRTLVELNYAVHYSYKQAGVAIVDHYTASRQFEMFEQNELKCGRKVTGDWTWLIPPISPSLVHNFHKGYDNTYHDPNFFNRKKGCPFLN